MNSLLRAFAVVAVLSTGALAQPQPQTSGEAQGQPAQNETPTLISRGVFYRLDVEKMDTNVYITLAKRWTFSTETFPNELVAKMKKDTAYTDATSNPNPDEPPIGESGYVRWSPGDDAPLNPGALLWFVNTPEEREVVVSVDLVLHRAQLGNGKPPRAHTFGGLRITSDLGKALLSDFEYNGHLAPPKRPGITSDDSIQVTCTGRLTDATAESVRSADSVLAGELARSLERAWQVDFQNESHHGITLGWLGHEQLRHGLIFAVAPKGAIDFQYAVSGVPFPLSLIEQQLGDNGWPLVLRGTEYTGRSQDGRHVYRPVEFLLSKSKSPTSENDSK